MVEELTQEEQTLMHTYNIYKILEISRTFSLPFSVQSTSVIFYRKIFKTKNLTEYNMKLLLKSIILLACKSENIHGNFDFLLKNQIGPEKNTIFEYEKEIAHLLNFNFHIPSPYLRMLGFIILLQEKGKIAIKAGKIDPTKVDLNIKQSIFVDVDNENINNNSVYTIEDVNALWNKCINNMDKIMVSEDFEKTNIIESALAALEIPIAIIDGVMQGLNIENIKQIRKNGKEVIEPENKRITEILQKIEG